MKTKALFLLGCVVSLAGLQPLSAQYAVGIWPLTEGAGTNIFNHSTNTINWNMTLVAGSNPGLWGYWQPGAYAFANGDNNAATPITAAAGWTSGDNLKLTTSFNVTGNLHDSGSVFAGGAVFGAGYYIPGGNTQGFNYGAFYAVINTANRSAPTIEFDVSGVGSWNTALPVSVCDPTINGGWNTAGWAINNNKQANSMTIQFLLNGTNVGAPVNIVGGYLADFSGYANYQDTQFYIGAAAGASYFSFRGCITNVSLVTVSAPFFTTPPATQTVVPGANVTFTAVAAGTAPLTYQWYYNGTNAINAISGATSASLMLSTITTNQAGAYTLIVSNSLGTVSATADLVVYVRALLALQRYNGLTIQGTVGFNYLIQYTDALSGTWQTLTNLTLPSSPYNWFDVQSPLPLLPRTYRMVAAP